MSEFARGGVIPYVLLQDPRGSLRAGGTRWKNLYPTRRERILFVAWIAICLGVGYWLHNGIYGGEA